METLLHVGLANAALATILALLVAGAARIWRRPAIVHSLWLLVLLKLLTPPLLPLPIAWPARPQPGEAEPEAALSDSLRDVPELRAPVTFERGPEDDLAATLPTESSSGAVEEAIAPSPAFPWEGALAIVWAAGSLSWWTLAGWRLCRFHTLLRHARPAPADLQDRAYQLAERLGRTRCPGVWLVPAPLAPMLWALVGAPRLLVPAALWQRLSEEQRDSLLLHELAHWRRGDHWVRRLELVVLGLYWWLPVVWWARRELREAEEQCCDAWVVWARPASAPAYAEALVTTLAFLSRPGSALPMGASGVGRLHPIKRRLDMIMRGTTAPALSWSAFLAVLVLAGALLPLWPSWARQAPSDAPLVLWVAEDAQTREEPKLDPAPRNHTENPGALPKAAAASQPRERSNRDLTRREALQQAQDEVELTAVQLDLKRAELREAQTHLQQAKRQLNRMERLSSNGAVSAEILGKTRDDAELSQFQVEQKGILVREAELRLQQAKRRLDNLQAGAEERAPLPKLPLGDRQSAPKAAPTRIVPPMPALPPGARIPPRRAEEGSGLEALEKKLDALLKEVEALRQELQRRRSSRGERSEGDADVYIENRRSFQIPFAVDEDHKDKVSSVELWVSTDQGGSWKLAAQSPAEAKKFTFDAPCDGLYWFAVRTFDAQGRRVPEDLSNARAGLKVRVAAKP